MVETAFSYCQLESGEIRPVTDTQILRGWVWPKDGGAFVDLRARIGSRVCPGVLGFPRVDIAAHFRTGQPLALAGFEISVALPSESVEFALDALDLGGQWRCVLTQRFTDVAGPSRTESPVVDPLRWIEYCHGLDLLLRLAALESSAGLRETAGRLAAEIPWPRILRHAPPPLIGFVDEPAAVVCNRFGRIPAFGHLFHPTRLIRRVLGSVDLQAWQPIPHGLDSPGPAAFYSGVAHAANCGFAGFVDVPAQLPNPLSLRLYAELDDRSVHLCQVLRARAHTEEDEKKPYRTGTAPAFDEAAGAWDTALSENGLSVARDAEWTRQVAQLRARFASTARRRIPAKLPPTHGAGSSRTPQRIILATHGLGLQGAPGFLLDLARTYAAHGVRLQVVSAEDGPLGARFADLGAKITIIDPGPVQAAGSALDAAQALEVLGARVPWREADLVVANSFTTFWAVHAAKAAGCPVLLYVHESTTPEVFFGTRVSPEAVRLAEDAFGMADAVSFTTAATRACHLAHGDPARFMLTPPWIDIAALDRHRITGCGTSLRERLQLAPDQRLVCNLGTVSDRKGQHAFARAVELLHRRRPDLTARTKFIMLGGRDTVFDRMLADLLVELGRPNLRVEPETPDYVPYYFGADVFACSSYEESSPRVVLEAMACGTPILASAVQGIPELVRADRDALLLPRGDTVAWCEGLAWMLDHEAAARELARSARERVLARFDATSILPKHWDLARAVAAGTVA
jgi:glycosyltransferase involved in cell wall biosynthesis